jgi:hypothetical protein
MMGGLSAKAYGILVAIIQHNLSISIDNLRLYFNEGERSIASGLKELRTNDFIQTKTYRIENRLVTMSTITEKAERLFFGVNPQSVDRQNVDTGISNEHISRITNSTVISKKQTPTKSEVLSETEEFEVINMSGWDGIFSSTSDGEDYSKEKRKSEFKKSKRGLSVKRSERRSVLPKSEWTVYDVCYEFAERIDQQWGIEPWKVTQSKFSAALGAARTRLDTNGEVEVNAMDIFFKQISISEYKDAEVLWRLFVSRLPGLIGQAVLSIKTDEDVLMAEEAWDKAQRFLRGEDV